MIKQLPAHCWLVGNIGLLYRKPGIKFVICITSPDRDHAEDTPNRVCELLPQVWHKTKTRATEGKQTIPQSREAGSSTKVAHGLGGMPVCQSRLQPAIRRYVVAYK